MAENATTPENARDAFINATWAANISHGGENERKQLVAILQNPDYRDALAACVNEEYVIDVFVRAPIKNDVDLLQAFADIGMNVNVRTRAGGDSSALRNAVQQGSVESIRWLLDHDANVDIQDKYGYTPLMYACAEGKVPIAEMLLEKNANPNIQTESGWSALMLASLKGHEKNVEVLLNFNPNVELKNNGGKTALDLAKNEAVKEMLLNHISTSYVLK